MKIELWMIGKTAFSYLDKGIALYKNRLDRYISLELKVFPDVKVGKKTPPKVVKQKEGEMILSKLNGSDFLILLDDKGRQFTSIDFANKMEHYLHASHKKIVFQIGGAYGFSEAIYERANTKMSLSSMTFSHQMVRLVFLEQLYRAMTILNGEPYHHE